MQCCEKIKRFNSKHKERLKATYLYTHSFLNQKNLDLSIYKYNFFKRLVFTLGQRHQNCWFTLLIAGSNINPPESLNVFSKKMNHFEGDECEGRCSVELNYGTILGT